MANISIKSDKITAFGGINFVLDKFDALLGDVNVDFDHQFIEAEKYDAKRPYKHFLGYSPGVETMGGNIVYLENREP